MARSGPAMTGYRRLGAGKTWDGPMTDIDGASFLTGANAGFIADLYARFVDDPASVDQSWRRFFSELGDDRASALAELRPPSWAKFSVQPGGNGAAAPGGLDATALRRATSDSIRALQLIRAYRVRGHLEADLDPLGLDKRGPYPELDYRSYGFSEADLDREIFLNNIFGHERASLREIIAILRQTYCGKIGVEYMHIQVPVERAWIQQKFETRDRRPELSVAVKREILEILTTAETFERFLDRRYTGTKRFGIEGAESLMPALEAVLRRGSALGIREFVIGMPHRGRLNVLANFVGKPFAAIFSEFQGNSTNPEHVHGSGDVKYHLGTSADREIAGRTVHLSLAANPSHLEAVDPVVLGKVRAKQQQHGDSGRDEIAGILMHGDAAFAGQGLVAESLELSELTGFSHRRHDPCHRQQPDRLYHRPVRRPFEPLPVGCRQGRPGADLSRQRRRSRSGRRGRSHRRRISPRVQKGCRRRPVLLSPARAQRGRRAGFYPAADVPHDRPPSDDPADLCRTTGRRGGPRRRRVGGDGGPVRRPPRKRVRDGEELSPEQGGLARRRMGGARTGVA